MRGLVEAVHLFKLGYEFGIKALRAMSEADFGVNTSLEQVMRLMVPFLAAGMRAEAALNDPQLAAAVLRPRKPQPAVKG